MTLTARITITVAATACNVFVLLKWPNRVIKKTKKDLSSIFRSVPAISRKETRKKSVSLLSAYHCLCEGIEVCLWLPWSKNGMNTSPYWLRQTRIVLFPHEFTVRFSKKKCRGRWRPENKDKMQNGKSGLFLRLLSKAAGQGCIAITAGNTFLWPKQKILSLCC